MLRSALIASVVLISAAFAADLPEKFAKRLESSETAYQQAVAKADNARFYAVQKANQERVKTLKTALTEATKAGDFDAASQLKIRIGVAESVGLLRPKPKGTVRINASEFAIIDEKVTWHVAKQICQEMGGHLATISTPLENEGLLKLSIASKAEPWVGATDEAEEGKWLWITGEPVADFVKSRGLIDNSGPEGQHFLCVTGDMWDDAGSGRRSFICEWGD